MDIRNYEAPIWGLHHFRDNYAQIIAWIIQVKSSFENVCSNILWCRILFSATKEDTQWYIGILPFCTKSISRTNRGSAIISQKKTIIPNLCFRVDCLQNCGDQHSKFHISDFASSFQNIQNHYWFDNYETPKRSVVSINNVFELQYFKDGHLLLQTSSEVEDNFDTSPAMSFLIFIYFLDSNLIVLLT